MEDIKVIYSNRNDYFLINHFNHNIINKKNNNTGTFTIDNNILEIKCNEKDKIEKFIKYNNKKIDDLEYIDTYIFISHDSSFNETKKIYFIHPKWEDFISLSFNNNTFIRESTNDIGTFSIDNDIINIKWEKYEIENFILNKENNNYYLLEYNNFDINNKDEVDNKSKNGIFFNSIIDKEILIYLEINSQNYQIFKNKVNITKNFTQKFYLKHINWEEEVLFSYIDKLIYRKKKVPFDLFIIETFV